MTYDLRLRDVTDDDVDIFFDHMRDPVAVRMAAFTGKDPGDRDAHVAHWTRIRSNPAFTTRTILADGAVVGHIASFERNGEPEVTYWIAREEWGRGIATRALGELLVSVTRRPIYARAAKDNVASIRVLEKCGFNVAGYDRGFANARDEEIDEVVLELK